MPAATDKREDELSFGEKLDDFMNKYRKIIIFGFLGIVLVLTTLVITTVVRDRIQSNVLTRLDALMQRHEEVMTFMGRDGVTALDLAMNIDIFSLIDELGDFGNRNSGFASARAFNMQADIYWELGNWTEAEQSWLQAARSASRTYLAPISYFNAAVAAEELGNVESAIAHYTSALSLGENFPSAARAQFAIGRLEESRNNRDVALASYRSLLNNWPDDPVWADLAQSRILMLSE